MSPEQNKHDQNLSVWWLLIPFISFVFVGTCHPTINWWHRCPFTLRITCTLQNYRFMLALFHLSVTHFTYLSSSWWYPYLRPSTRKWSGVKNTSSMVFCNRRYFTCLFTSFIIFHLLSSFPAWQFSVWSYFAESRVCGAKPRSLKHFLRTSTLFVVRLFLPCAFSCFAFWFSS